VNSPHVHYKDSLYYIYHMGNKWSKILTVGHIAEVSIPFTKQLKDPALDTEAAVVLVIYYLHYGLAGVIIFIWVCLWQNNSDIYMLLCVKLRERIGRLWNSKELVKF